jgi:hypothetical protein
MCVLLRKGRANWQFAWFSRKTASKESRQTGSLPYLALRFSLFQDAMKAPAENPWVRIASSVQDSSSQAFD